MKTLVVDDELVSRRLMQGTMAKFGECEAVESGNKAIVAFENAWKRWAPFDLITLDISMPGMDGIEVLLQIRKREKKTPKETQVKIPRGTVHSDKDNVSTWMTAGCDDYIVKPFNRETIIKKIEKIKSGEQRNVAGGVGSPVQGWVVYGA